MPEVAVVTDSGANLPVEVARRYDIRIVPLWLRVGGKLYRDEVEISADEFYRQLSEGKLQASTSQPSVGEFLEIYRGLTEHARSIISIHLPKKLSGTFSSAYAAAHQLYSASIEIIDSGSGSMGQGFITLEAAKLAAQGANLPQILAKVERIIPKVNLYAMLDSLEYILRGGRLSLAAHLAKPILQMKSVISLRQGSIRLLGFSRSRSKGIDRMLSSMAEEVGRGAIHVAILHANALEAAQRLRQAVIERFNCLELYITTLTPVLGTHGGPGVLGLAFYRED